MMAVMFDSYDEETLHKDDGSSDVRVVARFPIALAPVKFAILPLMEKDDAMVEMGEQIFHMLKKDYYCEFDTGAAIGKRYRRQDEIGTPFCVTIDHQSLQDGTVTLRHRDSMKQERVKPEELASFIK